MEASRIFRLALFLCLALRFCETDGLECYKYSNFGGSVSFLGISETSHDNCTDSMGACVSILTSFGSLQKAERGCISEATLSCFNALAGAKDGCTSKDPSKAEDRAKLKAFEDCMLANNDIHANATGKFDDETKSAEGMTVQVCTCKGTRCNDQEFTPPEGPKCFRCSSWTHRVQCNDPADVLEWVCPSPYFDGCFKSYADTDNTMIKERSCATKETKDCWKAIGRECVLSNETEFEAAKECAYKTHKNLDRLGLNLKGVTSEEEDDIVTSSRLCYCEGEMCNGEETDDGSSMPTPVPILLSVAIAVITLICSRGPLQG